MDLFKQSAIKSTKRKKKIGKRVVFECYLVGKPLES